MVKEQTISKTEEILSNSHVLIVHNDDINSFDWVIECLMSICNHEFEQACQCSQIIHNKGMCDVKYGDLEILTEMKEALISLGLSVTIESNI